MSIYGFAFDGALVTVGTGAPLPGAREGLAALAADAQWFITAAQSGLTRRLVTGDDRHPTALQIAANLLAGLAGVRRWPSVLLVATHAQAGRRWELAALDAAEQLIDVLRPALPATVDLVVDINPRCAVPGPGLLEVAADRLHVELQQLVYVGSLEVDRQAAAAAGVHFLEAASWRAGLHPA